MTIYVIRNDEFEANEIVDVTNREASAKHWLSLGRGETSYRIEEQADATEEEAATVEALKDWLIDNYEKGAHWIYETTSTQQFVVELRERAGDIDAYKASLSRHWEVIEDYAADIRAA